MVVDDLNKFSAAVAPYEANPPLVVDSDRMLSLTIAPKRFEPVTRRLPQIVECTGSVENQQLAARLPFDGAKARYILVREQARCCGVPERPDHGRNLFCFTEYRKGNRAGLRVTKNAISRTATPRGLVLSERAVKPPLTALSA